eukprot:CAMPEP_0197919662 /NCGR_PEP_ID=MMETSP1439-20131203/87559_1 /TAXON_ID=66791 /ORGANISM="Gonyaulax spinifera, Strain CCMP409" /LENGTH=523 /DNA_ID=CAMNT_0043541831 /DNA_START=52 /DNA_END=1623 /DNA_ORIENTATION=-
MRLVASVLCFVSLGTRAVGAEAQGDDGTCAVGEACGRPKHGGSPRYPWPHARGRPDSMSRSSYPGPKNLTTSLAWTWTSPHGPGALIFAAGPLIDDRLNIYVQTTAEIFKLTPEGTTVWKRTSRSRMGDTGSIADGAYFTSEGGNPLTGVKGGVVSLSMATGEELWRTPFESIGGDIGAVTAQDGYVVASVGSSSHGGSAWVVALNATTGEQVWDFMPSRPLWNFVPSFPGDGTMLFQTENGDAYRVRMKDGSVVWQVIRDGISWTDGGCILGPNKVLYAVHAEGHLDKLGPGQKSDLSAYQVSDGRLLWRYHYDTPPNSWATFMPRSDGSFALLFPYAGQAHASPVLEVYGWLPASLPVFVYKGIWQLYMALGEWGPSVFSAFLLGRKWKMPWPGGVTAFEPDSGKVLWEWKVPDWNRPEVKGDDSLLWARLVGMSVNLGQTMCVPNPWASPTVDVDGTMFIGWQDGKIYAVREVNSVGKEVDRFETPSAFSHPGLAIAPGMMAVTNCNTLYVFKDPSFKAA